MHKLNKMFEKFARFAFPSHCSVCAVSLSTVFQLLNAQTQPSRRLHHSHSILRRHRRPVSAGAWCLQPAARWQSCRAPKLSAMYSLRFVPTLLLVLSAAEVVKTLPKPPDHASDAAIQPPVNRAADTRDMNSLYAAVSTLPPPPKPNTESTIGIVTASTTIKPKEIERYPVISVSFSRVETPFIIGLWIFCASLAKIGE